MKQADTIPTHTLPGIQFLSSGHSQAFGEHSPSHRIDFYAIIWFTKNGATHYIDFEPYPIRKDCVYLIGRNQVHSIPSRLLPHAKTIVFSAAFFEQIEEPFLRQLFLPFENAGIQIPRPMLAPLNALFDLIVLENKGQSDFQLLLKYTTALLWHLYRLGPQHSVGANEDPRLIQLLHLIETDYKEHRAADFYARQIGLTPKRLNELLKAKTGATIHQLSYQLLLIEAKRALFHGQASIKEIAYNLGFADQSYFARFFKKHTGVTPEQFREDDQFRFKR
jgi:AraC-like DNA-binding protein